MERARVVSEDKVPADVVRMGSTVTFRSDAGTDGEQHELTETLVYPADEDSDANKLSVMTPVGAALVGLAVGQSISWTARDGRKHRLTVVKVS
jgi:regulator of nucleoside diphosphate kinase